MPVIHSLRVRMLATILFVATHATHAAPAAAQSASSAMRMCASAPDAVFVGDTVPDLAGIWDFSVEMGTSRSTGQMALGHLENYYAGALTPDATNTVVIRRLTVRRDSLHMEVASREGDVLFDGRLLATGDSMCGMVTYHGGARFALTATRRVRR